MIKISKATRQDLPAVQALMLKYGNKMLVGAHHLNKKDIALQARTFDGELVGFMWVGLMANNHIAYVDKVAVDPHYNHQGISGLLYLEALRRARRGGVTEFFGVIRQDEFHDKSCINALRVGVGAEDTSYTYVRAQMDQVLSSLEKELGIKLGDTYGR